MSRKPLSSDAGKFLSACYPTSCCTATHTHLFDCVDLPIMFLIVLDCAHLPIVVRIIFDFVDPSVVIRILLDSVDRPIVIRVILAHGLVSPARMPARRG